MGATTHKDQGISIIIPTFNEAQNIQILIPEIHKILRKFKICYEIIIVDDNSPDSTGSIAKKLAEEYSVKVKIRKNEKGLASAVLEGFKIANNNVILVMDADGSHPVETIPKMFKMINDNCADIVIGSRYHRNSKFINWPWYRNLLSRAAFLLTKGLTNVTDPTTGFFAIKKALINNVALKPIGWKIALEIMVKAKPKYIKEIPITFKPRMFGKSKLSIKEQINFLWHIINLYLYKYKLIYQFIKFGIVGSTGILIDSGIVILTKSYFNLDLRICAALGFIVASTTNFFGNLLWAFKDRKNKPNLQHNNNSRKKKILYHFNQYFRFLIISIIGLSIKISTIQLLITFLLPYYNLDYKMVNLIGIFIASIANFFGYKFIVFNKKLYKIKM